MVVSVIMKTCQDCHKDCRADCCRFFVFSLPDKPFNKFINLPVPKSADLIRYYRLHGVKVSHGFLRIKVKDFRIVRVGELAQFWRDCDLLKGFLCSGHPFFKPKVCQDLDGRNKGAYTLPPGCMYRG